MQVAIERVIQTMWDRCDEPLTLTELAEIAIISKFHFARVFRTVTGISPGRFLTAIRLCRAKNLLLATSISVTEISYHVGYNSLGTFTSRFTRSVGMSPSRYRYLSRSGIPPVTFATPGPERPMGGVYGALNMPQNDIPTRIYVATFDSPLPQGLPVACDIVDSAGSYRMDKVPDGEWFIQAAAVAVENVDPRPWRRKPLYVNVIVPVRVTGGGLVRLDLDLHPTRLIDLPILLALPELDSRELPSLVPFSPAAR